LAFLRLLISRPEGALRFLKLVSLKVGVYHLVARDLFHCRNLSTNWLYTNFFSISFVNCLHKNLRSYSYLEAGLLKPAGGDGNCSDAVYEGCGVPLGALEAATE
jgi:hypothetical protein